MVFSFFAAVGLAFIHLFSSRLKFLDVAPRSRWLSIAGGVAVSYVLIHLLPELEEYGEHLLPYAERINADGHAIYLLILFGLVVFYGLEKLARKDRNQSSDQETKQSNAEASPAVFWLHVASYGLYNALIGYLLVREDRSLSNLVLFFVGIGLHFVVNDHGLREHHRDRYRRVGRWILSFAIMLGWAVGYATDIHEAITGSVIAFLAGGILLNTFKEELPEESESRFLAFAAGTASYAAILLLIG